jgi:hypothetical protein
MNASFSVLSVLSFILSIAACLFVARIATQLRELRRQPQALPLSRLKSLETSLEETQDALAEVANRVKMMRVRSATNHVRPSNATPDPHTDPDAWRKMMNSRLSINKIGSQ